VRQWVVSFPWRLRYLLALDAELCPIKAVMHRPQAQAHAQG
jgi:hypothetical protein